MTAIACRPMSIWNGCTPDGPIRRPGGSSAFWSACNRGHSKVLDTITKNPSPINFQTETLPTPALKRQEFQKEHKWEVGKAQLDWIAADIWPTGNDAAVKISIAKGTAPKRPTLTREAENELREVDGKIAIIKSRLDRLSGARAQGTGVRRARAQRIPERPMGRIGRGLRSLSRNKVATQDSAGGFGSPLSRRPGLIREGISRRLMMLHSKSVRVERRLPRRPGKC